MESRLESFENNCFVGKTTDFAGDVFYNDAILINQNTYLTIWIWARLAVCLV